MKSKRLTTKIDIPNKCQQVANLSGFLGKRKKRPESCLRHGEERFLSETSGVQKRLTTKIAKLATYVLGIDTSCDDTSAAVVCGGKVLSNVVASQVSLHRAYGGVFPTVAKLEHQKNIDPTVNLALRRAQIKPEDLAAIAVTVGPGLAPALEVGIRFAKELAQKWQIPLIAINHVEAHALSALLVSAKKNTTLPDLKNALAIVISGGHSEFIWINRIGDYEILGQTLDDAAGECLDKIGRMLGLGYPAAPVVEQLAREGNASAYPAFPLPLTMRHDFNLSFSGLKTHALKTIRAQNEQNLTKNRDLSGLTGTNRDLQGPTRTYRDQQGLRTSVNEGPSGTQSPERSLEVPKGPAESFNLTKQQICNFAAAAQNGVIAHLIYKLNKLFTHLAASTDAQKNLPTAVLLGGGVAANVQVRQKLRSLCRHWSKISGQEIKLLTPYTKKLCGDNAAMIALTGEYKLAAGEVENDLSALERQPNLKVLSWHK